MLITPKTIRNHTKRDFAPATTRINNFRSYDPPSLDLIDFLLPFS